MVDRLTNKLLRELKLPWHTRQMKLKVLLCSSFVVSLFAFLPNFRHSTSKASYILPGGRLRMCSDDGDMDEYSFEDALFRKGVMYFGDGQAEAEVEHNKHVKTIRGAYLFAPTTINGDNTVSMPTNGDPINAKDINEKKLKRIEIPLMPFEAPLFPGSREFLFIYEMRFRSLMNDVTDSKLIGRCFLSADDQVGTVGTLCKIVDSRKLESGKGFFVIEAERRFRIVSIEQRVPYITAVVELDYEDGVLPDDEMPSMIKLWQEIYQNLKIYLRIARLHAKSLQSGGYSDLVMEEDQALLDMQRVESARLLREIAHIEARIQNHMNEKGDEEKLTALRKAVARFKQIAGLGDDGNSPTEGSGDSSRSSNDDDNRGRYLYDSDEIKDTLETTLYWESQVVPVGKRKVSKPTLRDEHKDVDAEREQEWAEEEEAHDDVEFLSPEVRDTKPLQDSLLAQMTKEAIVSRATAFSHAVANLLSTDEYVMQQLLQSTDLKYRMKGLKASLNEALEDITDAMEGTDMEVEIESIVVQAMRPDDDDSDLMPPPAYVGVTLDSMIDAELLSELNEKEAQAKERQVSGDELTKRCGYNSVDMAAVDASFPGEGSDSDEDDIWGDNSAFSFQ